MLCHAHPASYHQRMYALAPEKNASHLLPGQITPAFPGCVRGVLRYAALMGGPEELFCYLEQLDLCDVAAKARELYALDPFTLPPPPPSP